MLRPLLVFHDGQNTYIQPSEAAQQLGMTIKEARAERYGPYIMVRGIPQSFTLSNKAEAVTITYVGAQPQGVLSAPTPMPSGTVAQYGIRAQVSTAAAPLAKPFTAADVAAIRADAKVSSSSLQMAAPDPSCSPRAVRSESAYIVGFEARETRLTGLMINKLRQYLGQTGDIEAVHLKIEAPLDNEPLMTGRIKAIRQFLVDEGVDSRRIIVTTRSESPIGSEMRIVRLRSIPCASDGIFIDAPTRDMVTVTAAGDTKDVIRKLAGTLGIFFRVEGEPVDMPISVAEFEKPLAVILERIGARVADKADIAFREFELVIRYRKAQP